MIRRLTRKQGIANPHYPQKDEYMATKEKTKTVETITHHGARRKLIPTAEYQSVMRK